jgi:5'-methylthioinosine phosphorylase
MARVAVIAGHSLLGPALQPLRWPPLARRRAVPGSDVTVLETERCVVLVRHGLDTYVPAHRLDHAANLGALAALGCDRVLALSSVGSLRTELGVGAILAPDDFIALDRPPVSAFDDARAHVVPGFDPAWRAEVVSAWSAKGVLVDGGVYWQANGPRFETPAEIRYVANFADVVGMTVASECIAANELALAYAAVCIVDNLANGVGEQRLTIEEFEAGKAANQAGLLDALDAVVDVLA